MSYKEFTNLRTFNFLLGLDNSAYINRAAKAIREKHPVVTELFNRSLDLENLKWWGENEAVLCSLTVAIGWTESEIGKFASRIWTNEERELAPETFDTSEEIIMSKVEDLMERGKVLSLKHYLHSNKHFFESEKGLKALKERALKFDWRFAKRGQFEILTVILQSLSKDNHLDLVASLIKKDEEVTAPITLYCALGQGNGYLIKAIFDHPNSSNIRERLFLSPLFADLVNSRQYEGILFLMENYPDEIRRYLSADVNKEQFLLCVQRLLHNMIKNNDLEAIRVYFTYFDEPSLALIFQANANGFTPLDSAAEAGCSNEVIDFIIDNAPPQVQATLFLPNKKGVTPLALALEDGHVNAAKRILERAPVEARDKLLLAGKYPDSTPLHDLISNCENTNEDEEEFLKLLLDTCPKEIYPEFFKKYNGKTPLERAVFLLRTSFVKVIVKHRKEEMLPYL